MNEIEKAEIGAMLEKLDFVNWDRFVNPAESEYFFYGWIRRDDGYNDFVVLSYYQGQWWYITSSASMTHELARVIDGTEGDHCPCQRVEGSFDIPNMIRIGTGMTNKIRMPNPADATKPPMADLRNEIKKGGQDA